jgi:hypothetical protein
MAIWPQFSPALSVQKLGEDSFMKRFETKRVLFVALFSSCLLASSALAQALPRDSTTEEYDYWLDNLPPLGGQDDLQNLSSSRLGCAHKIQGAKVSESNTEDGVILKFESTDGRIDELQKNVQAMAERHNMMHGSASKWALGVGNSKAVAGQQHWLNMNRHKMVDSFAVASPTETGATILFTPVNKADLLKLREQVHNHQYMMNLNGKMGNGMGCGYMQ